MKNEAIGFIASGFTMVFAMLVAGCGWPYDFTPISEEKSYDSATQTHTITRRKGDEDRPILDVEKLQLDAQGRRHGKYEYFNGPIESATVKHQKEYQHGKMHGWWVQYKRWDTTAEWEVTQDSYYEDGEPADPPEGSQPSVSIEELVFCESPASPCQSYRRLAGTRPWFIDEIEALFDIGSQQVNTFLAEVEAFVSAKNPLSDAELEAAFDKAVKALKKNQEYKDTVGAYGFINNDEVMDGIKSLEVRLAIFDRVLGGGGSTYDTLQASYPGFLDLLVSLGGDLERLETLLDDVDDRMDQMDPLDLEDPWVAETIDERITQALSDASEAWPYITSEIVLRPGPGKNDGTDDGSESAGKDAYAWDCNGAYSGSQDYMAGRPRSTCNQCNSKAYIQFNLDSLSDQVKPDLVKVAYLGVTHTPHTTACQSMCSADFYFYPVLDPWDEMSIGTGDMPAEGEPVLGPLTIAFPNDFGAKEYDITEIYQDWKAEEVPNHGLVIYSPDSGCVNEAVTFSAHTSDAATEDLRPYLRVVYIDDPIVNAFMVRYNEIYREGDPLFQAVKGWYWGSKAAAVYVSPDGTCLGNSPCYETLQAGIDAAGDGFSVKVENGGYSEEVVLYEDKRIEFNGGYRADFSSADSLTTLRRLEIAGGGAGCSRIVVGPP